MSVAILDEKLMSSVFSPESQKENDIDAIILRARAAQERGQPVPVRGQAQQAETKYDSGGLELDGVKACSKALKSLTDAQTFKLIDFIRACEHRGLKLIVDNKQSVYLERLDGAPIEGDISDLFLWIYGFSECALLVYVGSRDNYIGYNLDFIARRFECDLFTAAYLATGIKRDLYIATCEDWNFKPEHIPPELEERIKFKPVPSNTKLRIFEVENKHGEIFKFQTSCIDEVLPDALKGLRVIQELTPTADASLISGNKSD